MIYIGIDPGVSGGIAAIDEQGTFVEAVKMPMAPRDLLDLLDLIGRGSDRSYPRRAVLEKAGPSPQMGVVSAFTFAKVYGGVLVALAAVKLPFNEIAPGAWQRVMGVLQPRGGDRTVGRSKDKNISKRRAQQLFPHQTVTHAIADALLLAEFCRRMERGSLRREEQSDGKNEAIAPPETEKAVHGAGTEFAGGLRGGKSIQREAFAGYAPKARTRTHAAVGTAAGHGAGPQSPTR
jgi:hypothetical protein